METKGALLGQSEPPERCIQKERNQESGGTQEEKPLSYN